jgi:hypothetical protein
MMKTNFSHQVAIIGGGRIVWRQLPTSAQQR